MKGWWIGVLFGAASSMTLACPAPRPPAMVAQAVHEAAGVEGVEPSFVLAVIATESAFDPYAESEPGAQGLMQVMPATQAIVGIKDPFSVSENVSGGTRYLRRMLERFPNVRTALMAYNAGPTRVMEGRIPASTYSYANKVLATYWCYRRKENG